MSLLNLPRFLVMRVRRVFLTVGTTSFDALIETVDTQEFISVIKEFGCQELILQIGRGAYIPSKYLTVENCNQHGIRFEYFRFKSTLADDMSAANLIISHCGAGSVLEAVTLRKLLLVVTNDTLQENHQEELADAMTQRKHCLKAVPKSLIDTLLDLASLLKGGSNRGEVRSSAGDLEALGLVPYPVADLNAFPATIDSMFSFH